MTVHVYNTKPQTVWAMRLVLGTVTRSEIRDFCPRANVGVLVVGGVEQEKDIRWVYVPRTDGGQHAEMVDDGDWLIKLSDGTYTILSDHEFNLSYERTAQ